jgi:Xaa-Pro aminopeptidase
VAKPDLRFSQGVWVISQPNRFNPLPVANPALLLYADTQRSADMRYFCGFEVHDPFIALRHGTRRIGVFNALEFGRARKESSLDEVLPLEPLQARLRERSPDRRPGTADVIALLAADRRLRTITVPEDFPAGLLEKLRATGLRVDVLEGPAFPEREIKTAREAAAIRAGNACAAAGFAAAERLLRAAQPRKGRLILDGKPLTSERVRFAIEVACLEAGGVAADTIVAGGDQACDPHMRGTGPLRPNELIIIDIFPRMSATGYHGDMTRTFLRGHATEAQRALVAAVSAAQQAALTAVRANVKGSFVHQQCLDVFAKRGYETRLTDKGSTGFFHGTGHGLGLAVHEAPRVSIADNLLPAGSVITVEPGLYYPGLGGCRIEDVVQVTAGRPRSLSSYPYDWELS